MAEEVKEKRSGAAASPRVRAKSLSKVSPYESTFGVRHRGPGRPAKDDPAVMLPAADVHPLIARTASRRAYAVVHEEQAERIAELYATELKVLNRRGVEEVAEDVKVDLEAYEARLRKRTAGEDEPSDSPDGSDSSDSVVR